MTEGNVLLPARDSEEFSVLIKKKDLYSSTDLGNCATGLDKIIRAADHC